MVVVTATVTDPSAQPCEGVALRFAAPEGHEPVVAMTDAGGVFRAELAPDVTYRLALDTALAIDGTALPAGTVLVLTVPDSDDALPLAGVVTDTIDASRPALLDMIAALTAQVATLAGEGV